jgi:hypothetical protein
MHMKTCTTYLMKNKVNKLKHFNFNFIYIIIIIY